MKVVFSCFANIWVLMFSKSVICVCDACVYAYIYVIQSNVVLFAFMLGFYRIPCAPHPSVCVYVSVSVCMRMCVRVCVQRISVVAAGSALYKND